MRNRNENKGEFQVIFQYLFYDIMCLRWCEGKAHQMHQHVYLYVFETDSSNFTAFLSYQWNLVEGLYQKCNKTNCLCKACGSWFLTAKSLQKQFFIRQLKDCCCTCYYNLQFHPLEEQTNVYVILHMKSQKIYTEVISVLRVTAVSSWDFGLTGIDWLDRKPNSN